MTEKDIPQKLTFKRKEVMQMTKLDGRVLDYWETEFAAFKALVNQSGEKFYSRRDVEIILKIKAWLGADKYDKSKIRELLLKKFGELEPAQNSAQSTALPAEKLKRIRRDLQEILTLLGKNDKD